MRWLDREQLMTEIDRLRRFKCFVSDITLESGPKFTLDYPLGNYSGSLRRF